MAPYVYQIHETRYKRKNEAISGIPTVIHFYRAQLGKSKVQGEGMQRIFESDLKMLAL